MDAMEENGLWRPLGELLVERELITPGQLEAALGEQAQSGRRLGEIIVGAGLVSRERLTQVLLEQCGLDLSTQGGFGYGHRGQLERRGVDPVVEAVRPPVVFRVERVEEEPATAPKRIGFLKARRFRKQLRAAAAEFDARGKALEQNLQELKRVLGAETAARDVS
jgi:hypothetical protein